MSLHAQTLIDQPLGERRDTLATTAGARLQPPCSGSSEKRNDTTGMIQCSQLSSGSAQAALGGRSVRAPPAVPASGDLCIPSGPRGQGISGRGRATGLISPLPGGHHVPQPGGHERRIRDASGEEVRELGTQLGSATLSTSMPTMLSDPSRSTWSDAVSDSVLAMSPSPIRCNRSRSRCRMSTAGCSPGSTPHRCDNEDHSSLGVRRRGHHSKGLPRCGANMDNVPWSPASWRRQFRRADSTSAKVIRRSSKR